VGGQSFPEIQKPDVEGWSWSVTTGDGGVVDWILGVGAEYDADLIVMTTEGHTGLLDLLRGSTTERVLRGARCPLLAIPA
ncbi:MAG: universal stress protein, partial [Nitrospiraceae bacterium]